MKMNSPSQTTTNNPVLEAIFKRRSIREYTSREVEPELLQEIVRAGIWAPSGLNNQPWRFVLIYDSVVKERLAALTKYSRVVLAAPALVAVYLDRRAIYNEVKDHQAAGACIQNMLLAAEALGLGAVWLGQILNEQEAVNRVLELDENHELMALIALGYPTQAQRRSQRKPLEEFILKSI